MRWLPRVNGWIVLGALTYNFTETAYFGWNWKAHSDAEIICDGISMLIMALAFKR